MKSISSFLLIILLVSCQENKKPSANKGQPFFIFDRVEYYHTTLPKKDLLAIEMKQEKSRKEQALLQIVTGDVPVSIADTLFIKNMEILDFKKDIIDPKLNSKIADLFSFREISKPVVGKNNPEYLDVLIFKREGHIIGMAKVGLDDLKHQMIGERYNDSKFGQSGEYQELGKILNQYKK